MEKGEIKRMLLIDIQSVEGSDKDNMEKEFKVAGIESTDYALTETTVKTIGHMKLDEFNKMMLELQQTFFLAKTPGGQLVINMSE